MYLDVTVPTATPFLACYLPYVLRKADQTLSAPFYAVLTQHGVARSEWRVLAVLHEFGDLTIAELAADSLSPQPTVTHALTRLERRGLIQRTLGTADKRQRIASITPAGAELTDQLITEAQRLETNALSQAGDLSGLLDELTQLTMLVEANVAATELQDAGLT